MIHSSITILRLLILSTCLLFIQACSQEEPNHQTPAARPVVVLKAYQETISTRVEALGTAQANESITITPNIAGRLEKISFSDGQQVNKGDIITEFDHDEELAQLAAATAQLAEQLREIERLKTLLKKKAAATRDLDERLTLATVARSAITEIKSRISDRVLRAPFAGKLGIRRISPGALVQPGQIITTLDAVDPIRVAFNLSATHLSTLHHGMSIEAYGAALPGEIFTGSITAIDSRIDPVSRSILTHAEIANPDARIKPGMLMHVSLLQEQRQALVAPEESITQREDDHFLTIITPDRRVELRKVNIGIRMPGRVEILDGLAAGEMIVVRGMGFLSPGQQVEIQQQWDTIPAAR